MSRGWETPADLAGCLTAPFVSSLIREWSLITGRGGLQNGRGGHVKFYPYEKGGQKKFSHSEGGGGTTSFGVDSTR